MSVLVVISRVETLRELPHEALRRPARYGKRRTFQPGSQLTWQADVGNSMHVIVKGRVRLERCHPQLTHPAVLAEPGPGDVVGHIGLPDHEPGLATVTAIEDTETVELSVATLAQMMLGSHEVSVRLLQCLVVGCGRPTS